MTVKSSCDAAEATVVARKRHTCQFCEQHIQKGERHHAQVVFPSWNPDVDYPYTFRAHLLCRAFWLEQVWPNTHDFEVTDWDEDKREYGWDEWLARRPTETHRSEKSDG